MINNDVLRRVRYALNLNDAAMMDIFALSDYEISREDLLKLLKKDNEPDFVSLTNSQLSLFLDGLITYNRGKREDSPTPQKINSELDNNGILRKLRIAFEFKEEDMLHTLKLADFELSKPELSSFFRHEAHKHHRKCGDQVLRNFLQGLIIHFRQSDMQQEMD
ncbi:hypothetical protein LBMAG43_07960 [Methylococcaceae bacterium]|nr:DUF1456 family protein [Methylococcales bacterium]GDX84754.1 hypothetical protein LBMAG43_07960 [Methylococcaceae bacterium]